MTSLSNWSVEVGFDQSKKKKLKIEIAIFIDIRENYLLFGLKFEMNEFEF